MVTKANFLILIIFSLIAQSCETQGIDSIETKTAVVEGYLHAGREIDSIKISQSFSYSQTDSSIIALDDLIVTLSDTISEYELKPIGNGLYQNLDVKIKHNQTYNLEFSWNNSDVTTSTYVPGGIEASISISTVQLPKITLGSIGGGILTGTQDPVEVNWNNTDGDYFYVVITNVEDDPEYVNDNVAASIAANGGEPRFQVITEPEISDFYAINTRREITQFGTHQVIVFRVNPEYAALYNSSGSSTLSLEEPPSNINNGLGIFTGVSSDTLYFEVEEI